MLLTGHPKSCTTSLLSSIFSISRKYQLFLSSSAASEVPAAVVEKVAFVLTQCQGIALGLAIQPGGSQQLLRSKVVVEAAFLKMTGWCAYRQQQRAEQQQQQQQGQARRATASSSCGRSSSNSCADSKSRSGKQLSSRSSHSKTTSPSQGSSSSRGPSTETNVAAADVPASYAALKIPHDHVLAAAALGKRVLPSYIQHYRIAATRALALEGNKALTWFGHCAVDVVKVLSLGAASEPSGSSSSFVAGGLPALDAGGSSSSSAVTAPAAPSSAKSIASSSSSSSSSSTAAFPAPAVSEALDSSSSRLTVAAAAAESFASSSSLPLSLVVQQQLLLEVMALVGAEVEEEGSEVQTLFDVLTIFTGSMLQLCEAERQAFISARGSLLLEVLHLTLGTLQQEQSTQEQQQGQEPGLGLVGANLAIGVIQMLCKKEGSGEARTWQ